MPTLIVASKRCLHPASPQNQLLVAAAAAAAAAVVIGVADATILTPASSSSAPPPTHPFNSRKGGLQPETIEVYQTCWLQLSGCKSREDYPNEAGRRVPVAKANPKSWHDFARSDLILPEVSGTGQPSSGGEQGAEEGSLSQRNVTTSPVGLYWGFLIPQ